jgi:hypothetical protein
MPQYIIDPKTGHKRLISRTIDTGADFYPMDAFFKESISSEDRKSEIKKSVEYHKNLYMESGNPLHVWAAFYILERTHSTIPAWIKKYMFSTAEGLLRATESRFVDGKQNHGQIALEALGLNSKVGKKGKGKSKNDFKQFSKSRYRQSIYEYINNIVNDDEIIYGKAKYESAYQHLANQLKCSKSKIRDIYKREEKLRDI